jgi:hypothetical protein
MSANFTDIQVDSRRFVKKRKSSGNAVSVAEIKSFWV